MTPKATGITGPPKELLLLLQSEDTGDTISATTRRLPHWPWSTLSEACPTYTLPLDVLKDSSWTSGPMRMAPQACLAMERAEARDLLTSSLCTHVSASDKLNPNLNHPKFNLQRSLGNVVLGFPASAREENTRKKYGNGYWVSPSYLPPIYRYINLASDLHLTFTQIWMICAASYFRINFGNYNSHQLSKS